MKISKDQGNMLLPLGLIAKESSKISLIADPLTVQFSV